MFKDKLKQLRKKNGVTQTQLGEYCGYSHAAVVNWESGQREPNIETLVKIADFFGVTLDYLVGYDLPKEISSLKHSNYVQSIVLSELSQDRNFVDSAKLYKAMDDEYKKQICAYILGIAVGLGLNVQQILGR